MSKKSTYEKKFRRRLEGKTNYKKRLALLRSGKIRLVVRRSNKHVRVQFIKFDKKGDITLAEANTLQLRKMGWNAASNTPSAYLTGLLAGIRAKKAGIAEAILDIGMATPVHGAACFAALKGAIDAGIKIPAGESAFPKEDRIEGKHIETFAISLNNATGKEYCKKFSEMKDRILKM